MVVLEAFGLAAAELFNYNREIYKFDQEQRLEKDLARVEMQIKRFDLFREDIEDLVGLTVSKMDMYHMVGALLLAFTCTIYTEGLFRTDREPAWFTGVYYLSVCGAFMYLLLAVWLSMHASIQAHSYGVRLRTRFVRLPIPSLSFITDLTARYADFERQGITNLLRLPFSGMTQEWKRRAQLDASASSQQPRPAEWGMQGGREGGGQAMAGDSDELIGRGDDGFGREDILAKAAATVPGRHVQLFRRLQAKWQCYDAYARVSMSLGVNQIIQAVNYFVIGSCLVERNNPSAAIAATIIFQAVALGLMHLDIADKPISTCLPLSRTAQVVLMWLVGAIPTTLTVLMLIFASTDRGGDGILAVPSKDIRDSVLLLAYAPSFYASPMAFFAEAIWFQLMLIAAWPTKDEATLPRKFLAVLFLDVFGDATYDPTEGEQGSVLLGTESDEQQRARHELAIADAERALETAQAALRRWEATPQRLLEDGQREQLQQLRADYDFWRKRLQGHIVHRKALRGVSYDPAWRDSLELRPWSELSEQERNEDAFVGTLIGPLRKRRALRAATDSWYDLNGRGQVESSAGRVVLSLDDVSETVSSVRNKVRDVLASAESGSPTAPAREDPLDQIGASRAKAAATMSRKKERLPWKILRRLTHVLQLCWTFLGVQLMLQNSGALDMQWFYRDTLARRLQARSEWPQLLEVDVAWPHGGLFRPTSISCLPGASLGDAAAAPDLLVSGPYASYRSAAAPGEQLRLRPLPREAVPAGAVAVCDGLAVGPAGAPAAEEACWLAAPTGSGVALWPWGARRDQAVELPLEGRPWELLAGAALPCAALAPQAVPPAASGAANSTGRCLVLAGWDGLRLPVAVLRLAASASPRPRGTARWQDALPEDVVLRPRFDAPLEAHGARPSRVSALHLEPTHGRLWALLQPDSEERDGLNGAASGATTAGELQSWSLCGQLGSLGAWPLVAPRDLVASALCEDAQGALAVAGLIGLEERPVLLWAPASPAQRGLVEGSGATAA